MNIIFAGTPEFAAAALESLYAVGHHISLVLTQPDRPAGRGMQLQASAVKQSALAHHTPVAQPPSLKLDGKFAQEAEAAHQLLHSINADVMIVAAYGLLLPKSVLAIPRLGCINIHASLLPRWRGAAPIHRAIEAGDTETGITIMQMDEGLDTGPMLLRECLPIAPEDTTGSLHDKLARLGGKLIVECLHQLEQGGLQAIPQPEQGITYANKISKEEAALDFSLPAEVVARKIRAFNPFPGASAVFNGTTVKLWQAQLAERETSVAAGTVIKADAEAGVVIACGTGTIRVTELQKPGGKRLPAADFLKGFPLAGGQFKRP